MTTAINGNLSHEIHLDELPFHAQTISESELIDMGWVFEGASEYMRIAVYRPDHSIPQSHHLYPYGTYYVEPLETRRLMTAMEKDLDWFMHISVPFGRDLDKVNQHERLEALQDYVNCLKRKGYS